MEERPSGRRGVTLRLNLLGGFAARDDEAREIAIGSRKAQALLAFLALPPGKPQPREKLTGLLWSDRGEPQARSSLRQALSELRKALPNLDPPLLMTQRYSVWLDPEAVEVDAVALDRLIDEGTPEALAEATELYRGNLLDGLDVRDAAFEEWRRIECERLRERASEALKRLVDQQVGDEALATARRLLALDPLNEATHRILMRLYAEAGDRRMAIKQYESCRDVLQAELDLGPEAETRELNEAIRQGGHADSGSVEALTETEPKEALSLPDKPSIAVLPFVNLSGDAEQEYFSDGITDDITTELSRYQSLFIIARNSSFVYKGRAVNVRTIGRELGVEYVVEGSIRKAGNRVRISAQLVEAATGNHLWAERYDRKLEDIFAVQDEVTQAIASILPTKVSQAVFARARRKPTDNLTAYDYLLRGERYLRENYGDPEALKMFEKAIEIDPQCARAYAHSAVHYLYQVFASGMPAEESTRKAREQIDRALAIDDDDSSIRRVAALAYLLLGQHDRAKIHSERAIALNPNDVSAIFEHGFVLTYLGDAVGGLEWFRKGHRLDPHEPESGLEDWLEAYYMSRQYEKAIETFRRWRNPPFHMYAELAACYAQLGRIDEARAAVAEYERQRREDYNFAKFAAAHIKMCARQEDRDHWLEGYRKAGLPV